MMRICSIASFNAMDSGLIDEEARNLGPLAVSRRALYTAHWRAEASSIVGEANQYERAPRR